MFGQVRVNIFVNGTAYDLFQFVCIFLFVQITCNACHTCDVPTESKLPLLIDIDFLYTFAGDSIYRRNMMKLSSNRGCLSLGTSFSICPNASYDARRMC